LAPFITLSSNCRPLLLHLSGAFFVQRPSAFFILDNWSVLPSPTAADGGLTASFGKSCQVLLAEREREREREIYITVQIKSQFNLDLSAA
jgi:hypothetical protein